MEALGIDSQFIKHTIKVNYKLDLTPINTFLVYVFVFCAVFLPADPYNIKILTLGGLLIINFFTIINSIRNYGNIFALACLTIIALALSIAFTGAIMGNISAAYVGLIPLLIPVIVKYKIDYFKIFNNAIKVLTLLIIAIVMLDLLRIMPLGQNFVANWFFGTGNAMIGKGPELPINYMVFFKTSPLIFISAAYAIKEKKYIWSILFSLAILASGTRANIVMLIAVWGISLAILNKNGKAKLYIVALLLMVAIYLLVDMKIINAFIGMFTKKASSDATRNGHLIGIIEVWEASPIKFIFGSGFTSEFYSYGIKLMTSAIELSYWNLLRQVGVLLFIPIMWVYLYPLYYIVVNKRMYIYEAMGYLFYLVIAYTNPFLWSSTGMLALIYAYMIVYKDYSGERIIERRTICKNKVILVQYYYAPITAKNI